MEMTTDQLGIRRTTVADATIVAEHRVLMFIETGRLDADQAAVLRARLPAILQPMLVSGEYIGWFVTTPHDDVVAGAGVQMRHLLPRPETFTEREALVVNVYVAPDYRRQGLARRLMTTILDWCKEQGIERVVLHPSSLGRPLYESLGFVPTNELVCYQTTSRAVEVQPTVKHTSEQ